MRLALMRTVLKRMKEMALAHWIDVHRTYKNDKKLSANHTEGIPSRTQQWEEERQQRVENAPALKLEPDRALMAKLAVLKVSEEVPDKEVSEEEEEEEPEVSALQMGRARRDSGVGSLQTHVRAASKQRGGGMLAFTEGGMDEGSEDDTEASDSSSDDGSDENIDVETVWHPAIGISLPLLPRIGVKSLPNASTQITHPRTFEAFQKVMKGSTDSSNWVVSAVWRSYVRSLTP